MKDFMTFLDMTDLKNPPEKNFHPFRAKMGL